MDVDKKIPVLNKLKFENTKVNRLGKDLKLSKPILTFKIQKTCPRIKKSLHNSVVQAFSDSEEELFQSKKFANQLLSSIDELKNKSFSKIENTFQQVFYIAPSWGGIPKSVYKLDILKSGMILKTLNLSSKNYHSIGKSLNCDILLTHETISEFHAVLQHRKENEGINEKGIYLYDLNSKTGSFVNGKAIKPYDYVFLREGYIISFGSSTKKYILKTSKDSKEKEAELSSIELQEVKNFEHEELERLQNEYLFQKSEKRLKEDNDLQEINWGISEDCNENTNSSESLENLKYNHEMPLSQDYKNALKDWFKWEGYELKFQIKDKGFGHFYCYLDLTLDAAGSMERIEVNVIGDKMKAIDECTLKACNVLNQYGLLKQAYEEKQSLHRNWEAVDYYDSDEDNYLDRTGAIERKRHQRMQMSGKFNSEMDTHKLLLEKHNKIVKQRKNLQKFISLENNKEEEENNINMDPLDLFMSKLNKSVLVENKFQTSKNETLNLQVQEVDVLNLITPKGFKDF